MGIGSALVTGGAGAIGIEVCNQLAQRGIEVHLFDLPEQIFRVRRAIASEVTIHYGSVLDSSSLREAMDAYDVVIHLAAMLGVRRTELNKLRCLEINVEGTKRVLDVSIQHRVRKLVFASSSEVYGEPLSNPVDEDAPTQGKTIYAVSKLAGEELCKAYAQSFPWFSYVILRYFNTYGPFQTAQFVVPKFVANILANKPPVIYGDGAQKRSYCYVSDTARATVEAAFSDRANGSIFNIGSSDTTVNLWELAGLVIDVAG
ncbi:MAG: NAD-dependent epimerase/dehydratase family protein [Anaerolineales bacterium]